jgi:hypothetical protein
MMRQQTSSNIYYQPDIATCSCMQHALPSFKTTSTDMLVSATGMLNKASLSTTQHVGYTPHSWCLPMSGWLTTPEHSSNNQT